MGNSTSRVRSGEQSNAIRLRIGQDFLRVDCTGQPSLVSEIKQSTPDQHYTFYIQDVPAKPGADTPDGQVANLKAFRHVRHDGRMFYLCAKRQLMKRSFRREVTLKEEETVTENSTWALEWIPGESYIVKSCKFQNYCLASHDGRLCLERVSLARRSRRCRFYRVNKEGSTKCPPHVTGQLEESLPSSDRHSSSSSHTGSSRSSVSSNDS